MTIIESRRQFLKRLGYAVVGALIVPIPKIFYSFPTPQQSLPPLLVDLWPDMEAMILKQLSDRFALELEHTMIFGTQTQRNKLYTREANILYKL